jgi:hypothetical protein
MVQSMGKNTDLKYKKLDLIFHFINGIFVN